MPTDPHAALDAEYRGWAFGLETPFIPKRHGGGWEIDTCLSLAYFREDKHVRLLVLLFGFGFKLGYFFGAPKTMHMLHDRVHELFEHAFSHIDRPAGEPAEPTITKH